jgi:hypothetical protein
MKSLFTSLIATFLLINVFSQQSSYKISITPSKIIINPDDTLYAQVNISGYGKVIRSKLMIYSDDKIRFIDEKGKASSNTIYWIFNEKRFLDKNEVNLGTSSIPPKELEYQKGYFIGLISKETGNHTVVAIFTYFDGENYYTDRYDFNFYVNTWLDRNQTWLIILGVIISLIALFQNQLGKLWNYVFKSTKKSKNTSAYH